MAAILTSLQNTVIAGIVLSAVLFGMYIGTGGVVDHGFYAFLFRWLHVISGVMWIGILWYFNFVQIPNMPNIPDDQKPAISKVIAPAALWWFRWGAMATLVTGIILAALNGYLIEAIALGGIDGVMKHTMIGIGMWLGTIMFFNAASAMPRAIARPMPPLPPVTTATFPVKSNIFIPRTPANLPVIPMILG